MNQGDLKYRMSQVTTVRRYVDTPNKSQSMEELQSYSPISTPMLTSFDDTRSAPLLHQPSGISPRSVDNMGPFDPSLATPPANSAASAPTAVSRPRPEIILRWKRFAILVTLAAVIISAITVTLYIGIPLIDVTPADAESKVLLFNSYSGVFMGFLESGISVLLGYLFPVFVVYLHNLKWSRHDDPATKEMSKGKKVALLLFFPIVMVAIGNSLSAVQTNQSANTPSSSSTTRRALSATQHAIGNLFSSVVHGAVEPMGSAGDDDPFRLNRVAAGTRVVVGMPIHEWLPEVLQMSTEASESLTLDQHPLSDDIERRAGEMMSTTDAVDLFQHGLHQLQLKAKDIGLSLIIESNRWEAVRTGASWNDLVSVIATTLGNTDVFDASGIVVTLEHRDTSHGISADAIHLKIPLRLSVAPTVLCGATACALASPEPFTRLRAAVSASRFSPGCHVFAGAACKSDGNTTFIFGSAVSALSPTQYELQLSFSKVSSVFTLDDSTGRSSKLRLQLPTGSHLVATPDTLAMPGQKESAITLVQLVEPPVIVSDHLAAVKTIPHTSSPSSSTKSGVVDRYSEFLEHNDFARLNLLQTAFTAGLAYLFQNASYVSSSPVTTVERHLQQTSREYQIYVSNTKFGAIATWIACGILLFLSTLVLVFPNARARLEPPKGGNARAERFIAVQTEEVYPNLIYKKRFRIGKTGEKIKFREFAVEAVTLHHRMEEDEQIDL